jgi:hypothetical protein
MGYKVYGIAYSCKPSAYKRLDGGNVESGRGAGVWVTDRFDFFPFTIRDNQSEHLQ